MLPESAPASHGWTIPCRRLKHRRPARRPPRSARAPRGRPARRRTSVRSAARRPGRARGPRTSACHHCDAPPEQGPDTRRPPPVASGMAALMLPGPRERRHRTVEVAGIEPVWRRWDRGARGGDLCERERLCQSGWLGSPRSVDGVNGHGEPRPSQLPPRLARLNRTESAACWPQMEGPPAGRGRSPSNQDRGAPWQRSEHHAPVRRPRQSSWVL